MSRTSSVWRLVRGLSESPAGCFIGHSVGLPAALQIAAGFGRAMFGWHSWQLLLAELGTLALVWYIGTRGASSSANLQTVIAGLIVALIVAIWWAGDIKPANIPFPAR